MSSFTPKEANAVFTTVSETTLQESALPQTTSAPLKPEESRLVLGNRQIAAALFMVLALVTVIATLSYIAGRATPAGATATVPATVLATPRQTPEQVIVVDAKSSSTPQQPAAPAAVPPQTSPLAPAVAPGAPIVLPTGPDSPPAPGTVFFQVASVDKGMADVSVQYLLEKGFSARRAPGASAGVYRVLAGPLDVAQMAQTELKLKELGFSPFPKKY
jgi:type IV secretory pathway VirB10-like protein